MNLSFLIASEGWFLLFIESIEQKGSQKPLFLVDLSPNYGLNVLASLLLIESKSQTTLLLLIKRVRRCFVVFPLSSLDFLLFLLLSLPFWLSTRSKQCT